MRRVHRRLECAQHTLTYLWTFSLFGDVWSGFAPFVFVELGVMNNHGTLAGGINDDVDRITSVYTVAMINRVIFRVVIGYPLEVDGKGERTFSEVLVEHCLELPLLCVLAHVERDMTSEHAAYFRQIVE